jgi:hypothetical protein
MCGLPILDIGNKIILSHLEVATPTFVPLSLYPFFARPPALVHTVQYRKPLVRHRPFFTKIIFRPIYPCRLISFLS